MPLKLLTWGSSVVHLGLAIIAVGILLQLLFQQSISGRVIKDEGRAPS